MRAGAMKTGLIGPDEVRRIADAGVNLELVYLATATRLVVGADDLEAARGAL